VLGPIFVETSKEILAASDDRWEEAIEATLSLAKGKPGRCKQTAKIRSALLSVTAIFVTVFVFDAYLHPATGFVLVIGVPVTPTSLCAVRSSVIPLGPVAVPAAILVAIAILIAVAVHSPARTHFSVFPAHAVAVSATHPAVAIHLSVVVSGSITLGALPALLPGVLIRLRGSRLRRGHRRFPRFLS
jgi:hypothetical protein